MPTLAPTNERIGIWQHHGDVQKDKADNIIHPAGSCPGVTGACDLNTAYKDYAAIIKAAGLNGFGTATTAPPDQSEGTELDILRIENAVLRASNAELKAELETATDKLESIRKVLIT